MAHTRDEVFVKMSCCILVHAHQLSVAKTASDRSARDRSTIVKCDLQLSELKNPKKIPGCSGSLNFTFPRLHRGDGGPLAVPDPAAGSRDPASIPFPPRFGFVYSDGVGDGQIFACTLV